MEIVHDHRPAASIVVDKNASDQVKSAARTLQDYLAKSTEAVLPLLSTPGKGISIHVGKTVYTQQQNLNLGDLDQDGFVLKGIDDKNYIIVGGSDWGTEFGVYEFLERYVGVRWLFPTEIGEDIPPHATLDILSTPVRQEPVYLSRRLSPINIEANNSLGHWGRFNRARGRIAFHHNMLHLFPADVFGKTHPEFYPLIDGKRYIPSDDNDQRWQPNFSAPGIEDAAVEQIEKYFQQSPTITSYSLGMNDSNNWDQSPASKARRNGHKNYLGFENVSDDFFAWADNVVGKVLLTYPDKWFGTLAYNGIAEPPTRVGVNARIVPFITYDRMRWEDPKLREFGHQLTERWAKVSPMLGWYDYVYGMSYLLPRVYFHTMQKYLSWGAAHHVKFYYAELYPNWGEGPKPWVLTKLLWNPNQDVDALLDDWYNHCAGPAAAPELKAFYAIWEKFWTQDIYHSKWNTDEGQYLPFNTEPSYLLDVPKSYIDQSDQHMNRALQLADTPQHKVRVAKLKEMWDFYKASIITYQAEELAVNAELKTSAQALALLDKAEQVLPYVKERQQLLEAFAKDPLYSASAAHITHYSPTAAGNWGMALLWRLEPWIEKDAQVKTRLRQLTNNPDPAISGQANILLQAVNRNIKLVSSNASFENNTNGWRLWDKSHEIITYHPGTWTVSSFQAHSGNSSLQVKGLQRGGPIQSIPYQPGSYFARACCYVPPGTKAGSARLELGVSPSNSGIHLPSSNIPLRPGAWSSIAIPFQLSSSTAKTITLMLILDGFEPHGEIYLDDIGIYRVGGIK